MDHHIPSPTSSHSGHERDDGPSHANAGAVSVFSETPNAALVSDSPHHVDDSHLSNWTAKQSDPVAPPLPIPTTGSDSSQQVGRLHPLPSSDADVHHAADPDDEASDSASHTSARSSATAYSLDATHLRERVTSVGRLPKGTAASRRLAALFGDLPPTSPASTSSAASSTSSYTPTPASRDRPPRPQPRARSPSPPPASSHQRAPHPTSPSATPTPTPTTSDSDTPSTAHPAPGSGLFECNICLDTASHPVVTLCGHLFCWPCLDPWFKACTSRHAAVVCPVCKSGCGPDKTIPIFARGREAVDPRTSPSSSSPSSPGQSGGGGAAPEATPSPRPEAQRSEPVPPPRTWRNAWGFGAGQGVGGGGGVNVQFGMFPGLFGMTINLGDGGAGGPEAMRGDPQENQNISSVLTLMGVMILMNLFFGLFLY